MRILGYFSRFSGHRKVHNILLQSCQDVTFFDSCSNFGVRLLNNYARRFRKEVINNRINFDVKYTRYIVARNLSTNQQADTYVTEVGVTLPANGITASEGGESVGTNRSAKKWRSESWIRPEGYDTGIKVVNSLTRSKEALILPQGKLLTWYACGPTVYDEAHIGHASSYIRMDVIRRTLLHMFNIDVIMVMGITDIDDKIIDRANVRQLDMTTMTRSYETKFFDDMASLRVLPPTINTRVTHFMSDIVHFVQCLVEKKHAYKAASGSVYFDVIKYGGKGKLWPLDNSTDEASLEPGDKEKKNRRDFALWKAAKPGEPWWPSPWGNGRPGWHIECSAMASAIFGRQLDVHSGGEDLKFPHHENEIVQSEAFHDISQWANYFIHTGHLHLRDDTTKMSKSVGNTVSVSRLLQSYTCSQFRLFCLLSPYRNGLDYSPETMRRAVSIDGTLSTFLATASAYVTGQLTTSRPIDESLLMQSLAETRTIVESSMCDDFDTPRAIQAIERLVRVANIELNVVEKAPSEVSASTSIKADSANGGRALVTSRSPGVVAALSAYLTRLLDCWGLADRAQDKASGNSAREEAVLSSVVKFRRNIRMLALNPQHSISVETKEGLVRPLLQQCDEIRDELKYAGVKVKDHPTGTTWEFINKPK